MNGGAYHRFEPQAAEKVGERLRKERGVLTQAELAELVDFTQQMISRYESGRVPPSWYCLANLARKGFDVGYILTGRRTQGAA